MLHPIRRILPTSFRPAFARLGLAVLLWPMAAAAQDDGPALAKLLAAIERTRVEPAQLTVVGRYALTFAGQGDQPMAAGGFREIFSGQDRARQTSLLGELGAMEHGLTPDFAWSLDPMLGAKVHAGPQAEGTRRYFALLRGAAPRALYREFELTEPATIDGVVCRGVRMTTATGAVDTWFADAADGLVRRIDTALPAPESADVSLGRSDLVAAQLVFGDWRERAGMLRAHRRTLTMGSAVVTVTVDSIDTATAIAAAAFAPPQSVLDAAAKAARTPAKAVGAYEEIERQAQPVASIRVRCKPDAISATLAIVLPEVMAHCTATGARIAGAPFSRYHAFSATEVDLEAGLPVQKPIEPKGRVVNSELPAGRTVTGWHIGAYEGLQEAHLALAAHVAAKKLSPRGGAYEIYWTDPGMVPDPSKWRTQLFQPVE